MAEWLTTRAFVVLIPAFVAVGFTGCADVDAGSANEEIADLAAPPSSVDEGKPTAAAFSTDQAGPDAVVVTPSSVAAADSTVPLSIPPLTSTPSQGSASTQTAGSAPSNDVATANSPTTNTSITDTVATDTSTSTTSTSTTSTSATSTSTSTTSTSTSSTSEATAGEEPGPGTRASVDQRLQGFQWPAEGELGLGFGYLVHPVYGSRRLIAGQNIQVPEGTPVRAAKAGVVEFARRNSGGYGSHVIIDHGDGVRTLYAHNRFLLVEGGEPVSAGEQIAESGTSGATTGPVLFFVVTVDDEPIDPLEVLPERK